MPVPKQQFFLAAGIPLVGGKIYTYAAGTTTPKNTYTDSAGVIPQANPIILNARGEPANAIFWSGAYKVEVHDALDNLIYTVDNYNTDPLGVAGISSTILASFASSTGSSLIGFTQAEAGAVVRTMQDHARETVQRNDYGTLSQALTAAGFRPVFDTITGKSFFSTDNAPLDYSTTRAGSVWQHRDTAAGALNELIPGAVFQFNSTGNGIVNAGIELSQSIWQGLFSFMNKTGDGSAHSFTSIGQLGVYGPGAYNELGLFQGEGTNLGSALGTMSGVEVLLKDSPDAGATTFSTKMQGIVGRIAKYNPTIRKQRIQYVML